jgi:hypothetical protein
MVEINEVYGLDYQMKSIDSRINSLIDNLGNNIANEQYRFRLHDTADLWNNGNKMSQGTVSKLINKVMSVNKRLYMCHINQNTNAINMIPVLIAGTPVEYFYIVDQDKARVYFIYITPNEVNAY